MAEGTSEEAYPSDVDEGCGEETGDEVEGPGTGELGRGEEGLKGLAEGRGAAEGEDGWVDD